LGLKTQRKERPSVGYINRKTSILHFRASWPSYVV
jgi:hypothetical protein